MLDWRYTQTTSIDASLSSLVKSTETGCSCTTLTHSKTGIQHTWHLCTEMKAVYNVNQHIPASSSFFDFSGLLAVELEDWDVAADASCNHQSITR